MAELSPAVQIWTNWMMLVFMASVFFLRHHREARLALAAFVGTMVFAMCTFLVWRNVHLFALAHIVFWSPLLTYMVRCRLNDQHSDLEKSKAFLVWSFALMVTMSVSLVFDVRDVYLVVTGVK